MNWKLSTPNSLRSSPNWRQCYLPNLNRLFHSQLFNRSLCRCLRALTSGDFWWTLHTARTGQPDFRSSSVRVLPVAQHTRLATLVLPARNLLLMFTNSQCLVTDLWSHTGLIGQSAIGKKFPADAPLHLALSDKPVAFRIKSVSQIYCQWQDFFTSVAVDGSLFVTGSSEMAVLQLLKPTKCPYCYPVSDWY